MPALDNPRWEAFCQARAKGMRLDDAYERAGFVLAKGHSSRLSKRPEVAARIADLRNLLHADSDVHRASLIAGLLRIARASEALATPAGAREARMALVDAAKVQKDLDAQRALDQREILSENSPVMPPVA